MIIAIGCDIVEHKLVHNLQWNTASLIQKRIFSQNEIEIYSLSSNIKFLSGRFAAKEAILKCLGTGMIDGIALVDIQILKTKSGAPLIILKGLAKQISDELGINKWHITISHSSENSIAYVIAENNDL